MFIYGENYVGKQTSSNCEDAVHICFYLAKNVNRVKIDLGCADVWVFITMLMRVKGAHAVMFNLQLQQLQWSLLKKKTLSTRQPPC